jgi:hypothetical protein
MSGLQLGWSLKSNQRRVVDSGNALRAALTQWSLIIVQNFRQFAAAVFLLLALMQ